MSDIGIEKEDKKERGIGYLQYYMLINSRNRSGKNTVVWKEMFTYWGVTATLTHSLVFCSLCWTFRALEGISCIPVTRRSKHRYHEVKIMQRTRAEGISREVFSTAFWTVLWHKSSPATVTTDLIGTAQPETQLPTSHIHNKKQVQYKKSPETKSQSCKAW